MSRDTLRLSCLAWLTLVGIAAAQPDPNDVGTATLQNFSGGATFAGNYFQIQNVTGDGVGYQNGFTQLGHLLPFWINEDFVIASNNRLTITDTQQPGGNFGVFARFYNDDRDRIFGVNAFYDVDKSLQNFTYQQGTFGVETLGRFLDARANAYIPTSSGNNYIGAIGIPNPNQLIYFENFIGFRGLAQFQEALAGADVEVGVPLSPQTPWLRAYAGMYAYNSRVNDPVGFRGRLEGWVSDDLNIGVQVTDDTQFGTNVNASVNFLFSGWRPTRWFPNFTTRERMLTPVQRNWRVSTGLYADNVNVKAFNPRTGNPYFITWVDNSQVPLGDGTYERPYTALPPVAPGSDLILVRTGISPIVPIAGSIILSDYQRMLGQGREHTIQLMTQFGNANIPPTTFRLPEFFNTGLYPTITSAGNAITLTNNNEVSAFNINNSLGAGITNFPLLGSTHFDINCVNLFNNLGGGIALNDARGDGYILDVNALNNGPGGIRVDSGLFLPLNLTMRNVTSNATGPGTQAFGISINADNSNINANLFNIQANGNQTGIVLQETNNSLQAVLNTVDASNNTGPGGGIQVIGVNGSLAIGLKNVNTSGNAGPGISVTSTGTPTLFLGEGISSLANAQDNLRFTLSNGGSLSGQVINSLFLASATGNGIQISADDSDVLSAAQPFLLQNVTGDGNFLNGLQLTATNTAIQYVNVINSSFSTNQQDGINIIEDGSSQVFNFVDPTLIINNGRDGYHFEVTNNSLLQATLTNDNLDGSFRSAIYGNPVNSSTVNLIMNNSTGRNSGADGLFIASNNSLVNVTVTDGNFSNSGLNTPNSSAVRFDGTNSIINMTLTNTPGQNVLPVNTQAFGLSLNMNNSVFNGSVANGNFSNNRFTGIRSNIINNSAVQLFVDNTPLNDNGANAVGAFVDNSQFALTMTNSPGLRSGRDGMYIISQNNANIFASVTNGDFSNSGQTAAGSSAVRFDATDSLVQMTLANTPGQNTAPVPAGPQAFGLQLNLAGATLFNGIVTGGNFSNNLVDGVLANVNGTTIGSLSLTNTLVDNNGQDGINAFGGPGTNFTINATNSSVSGNGKSGVNGAGLFLTSFGTMAVNLNNTNVDFNRLSGIDGTTAGGVLNITTTNGTNIDNNNQSATLGAQGVLLNNLAGTVNGSFTDTSISNNLGSGVAYFGAGSIASSLSFTNSNVDNNGLGGAGLYVNEQGGVLSLTGTGSSFDGNGGSGVDITADNGATMTMNSFTNVTGDNNQLFGFKLLVDNGSNFNGSVNGGSFSGNGLFAISDGVNVVVDHNSIGQICFDGTQVNNNSDDGFDFLVQNASTLNAGLQTSGLFGTLTATGNANQAVVFNVGNGAIGNMIMNGANNFTGNLGNSAVTFNATNAAVAAFGFSGSASGYAGDAINVNMNGVAQAWIDIHGPGSISGNGGNGINLQLNTVTFANNPVTIGFLQGNLTAQPFNISNLAIENNAQYGVLLNASNVFSTGPNSIMNISGNAINGNDFDNVFALVSNGSNINNLNISNNVSISGAGNDGVSVLLVDTSTINALNINNNALADNNGGVGIHVQALGAGGINPTINGININGPGSATGNGSFGISVELTNVLGAPNISVDGSGGAINRAVNNNGANGINLVATNTPLNNVNISNNIVDPNQGDGIHAEFINSTTNMITISRNTVFDNVGDGIDLILTGSTLVNTINMQNNAIDTNQGHGLSLTSTGTAIGTINVTGNGSRGNTLHGFNFNLNGSPVGDFNILNNRQGTSTLIGLGFQIIGDTFAQPFSITNNSGPGINITDFQINLGPSGNVWDTVEPGGSTAFSPNGGTDVITGFTTVNGNPFPNAIPGGGLPDNQGLLNLTFTDFNPAETFSWDADVDIAGGGASTVLGSDLIGSTINVNFTGGLFLNGTLQALGGNGSQFVAAGGNNANPGSDGNTLDGMHFDIVNSNINNLRVNNNDVNNNTVHGINFNTVNGSTIALLEMKDNTITGNDGTGVRFGTVSNNSAVAAGVNTLLVQNNTINENAGHGVDFGTFTNSNLGQTFLVRNTINGNTGGDGVRLVDPVTNNGLLNLTFTDNTINNNSANGINLQLSQNNLALNLNMTGNTIGATGAGNGTSGTGMGLRLAMSNATSFNANIGTTGQNANTFTGNRDAGVGITMANNSSGSLTVQNSTFNNTVNGGNASFAGVGLGVIMTDFATLTQFNVGDAAVQNTNFNSNAAGGFLLDMHGNSVINAPLQLLNVQANQNTGNGVTLQLANFSSIGDGNVNGNLDLLISGTTAGAQFASNTGHQLRIAREDNSGLPEVQITGMTITGVEGSLDGISLFNSNGVFNTQPTVYVIDHNTISNNRDGVALDELASARVIAGINQNTISGNRDNGIRVTLNQATSFGDVTGLVNLPNVAPYATNGMVGNAASIIDGNTFSNNGNAGAESAIAITANDNSYANVQITGTLQRQTFTGDRNGITLVNNSTYANGGAPANVVARNTFLVQGQDVNNSVTNGISLVGAGAGGTDFTVGGSAANQTVNVANFGNNGISFSGALSNVIIQNATISHPIGTTGGNDGIHLELTGLDNITIRDTTIQRSGGDGIDISDTNGTNTVTVQRTTSTENAGRGLLVNIQKDAGFTYFDPGQARTEVSAGSLYNIGSLTGSRNSFSSNGLQGMLFVQRSVTDGSAGFSVQSLGLPGGPAIPINRFDNGSPDNLITAFNVINNDINSNGNAGLATGDADGSTFLVGTNTRMFMNYSGNGRTNQGVLGNLGDDFRLAPIVSVNPQTGVDRANNTVPIPAPDTNGIDDYFFDPVAHVNLLFGGDRLLTGPLPFSGFPVNGSAANPAPFNFGEQINVSNTGYSPTGVAGVTTNFTNVDPFKGGTRSSIMTGEAYLTGQLNNNVYIQNGVTQNVNTVFSNFFTISPSPFP